MPEQLRLQEIRPEGPRDVGALAGGEIVLGREPDLPNGIALGNSAISRNHGKFFSASGAWFYKDLGSTNGSWLNGEPIKSTDIRIVRGGDVVQLADTAVKISGDSVNLSPSVYLFENDRFIKMYPVPEAGRVIEIGGAASTHSIDGEIDENPSLIIERRGATVVLIIHSQTLTCNVSGRVVRGTVPLVDRDRVVAGPYTLVVSLPRSQAVHEESPQSPNAGAKVWLRGWEGEGAKRDASSGIEPKPHSGTKFGGRPLEEEEPEALSTIALDTADVEKRLARFDAHPSRRQAHEEGGNYGTPMGLEDKLVIVVGALLVVALLVVLVWWYLT